MNLWIEIPGIHPLGHAICLLEWERNLQFFGAYPGDKIGYKNLTLSRDTENRRMGI